MIPKIIHYCWFGKAPKSDIAIRCIASWEQHCPDFEIIEWNEKNTKPFQNKFYKDAYRKKHFAFAADCIRVQVLQRYGGIYFDTDMLLVKPLYALLGNHFFTGYEVENRAAYGLFGGYPEHRFFKEMAAFYENNYFNQYSLPVITHTFKELIHDNNLLPNERIYPPQYFYPMAYEQREEDYETLLNPESIAVHLWDHSWKKPMTASITSWLHGLKTVLVDWLFYRYPYSYFKRYFRGFSRKIYHRIIGKH